MDIVQFSKAKNSEIEILNKEIGERLRDQYNKRMLGIEDIKFLGGILVHIYEIFSRQSANKLPTDVMMLREDLDIKKDMIQRKLDEANNEF